MGLKTYRIDYFDICLKENLRLWIPFSLPKLKYEYEKLGKLLFQIEAGNRPKGGINYSDDEVMSIGGEQIGINGNLDLSNVPFVSLDFCNSSKKGKVKDCDILICKDGAQTGKTCLVDFSEFTNDQVMVNEHVFILRVNKEIHHKLLYYLTTTNLFQSQVRDFAYKKKAQPGLNLSCIKEIKIPKIPKIEQEKILTQIESVENRIKTLKESIQDTHDIINEVIINTFCIDLQKVHEEESKRLFFISSHNLSGNPNLRCSVRWHKVNPIQRALYEKIECIKKLGDYINSTKNGWSPTCSESDTKYQVLGLNCISESGIIDFKDIKFTNETRENVESFFVKRHDLFISRGNTVELVALASIADDFQEERSLIYPDLYIKLDINEDILDKNYVALLFNSIIGRYYFKYSSKGKNQTMVKISTDELYRFAIPIPSLEIQKSIVNKIRQKIMNNEEIRTKILFEKEKIIEIIENSLNN